MKFAKLVLAAATAALVSMGTPVAAEESSYTEGTVWNVADINVADGQFENYMDWLATQWKKMNELGKKEGYIMSYHVLQNTNPRNGEPNLFLVIEYKDFMSTAQRKDAQKKVEALLASDTRKEDTAFGERKTMRTVMGSTELQELKLK